MVDEARSAGSRARGLALIGLVYLVALAAAIAAGYAVRDLHPLWIIAIADLAGTAVVFACSVGLNNSSVYDPYWSVAPIPIAAYLAWVGGLQNTQNPRAIAVLVLLAIWGCRLTWNWARGWPGLHHEDWRYVNIRQAAGRWYWPVSLLGIHLVPTLVVFLGCLSLYPVMITGASALGAFDIAALVVMLGGIAIEAVADKQLLRFVRAAPPATAILDSGLWKVSRHPNYFGEIALWCGLCLFGLSAAGTGAHPWIAAGPLAMIVLFLVVSIPMIDRRMLARRPDYAERMNKVSRLVPWFTKR